MRLWSIHPKYLDKYGLIALWREGLLAQKVLKGETKGYKNNPQLLRFKQTRDPLKAIGSYLSMVASEGAKNGYKFNHEKILYPNFDEEFIEVAPDQVRFEVAHLKNKLKVRDMEKYKEISGLSRADINPIFTIQ